MYYKACTGTSQYYFVPQRLHKARPSTTLYCKACTNYSPVPLTNAYYFVLQSLHRHFPVLLCTTKLAQSASQYYFAPQSLHKPPSSTTVCYKACKKYFPVLLCTTRLAQSIFQYRGGTKTTPAASAVHRRAAATLHGKMEGFVLRLPPQNKAHATFMQPLQCVSQHPVANLHVSTHMATPDDNNHAAITRAYCYVMPSLTPQSHTTRHCGYSYVMSGLAPQSHTTLH